MPTLGQHLVLSGTHTQGSVSEVLTLLKKRVAFSISSDLSPPATPSQNLTWDTRKCVIFHKKDGAFLNMFT